LFSLLSGAEIPHSHDFTNFSHYYYSRLSANQKATYKKILSGIKTYAEEITIPYSHIDETNIIFKSILRDNPLVFYVTSFTQSSVQYKRSCTFIPDYTFGYCEVKEKTDAIQGYLRVFDYVKNNSDFEKELFIHDYCLENFSYDNRFGGNAYSVLGLVFNNSAVCEGIAKFVKLAFDYLSVKSLVVTGKSNNPHQCTTWESHAWNIVRIDGKTYHLDVTFDITLTSKRHRYDYFNLTDEDIKKDHIISDTVPACITNGIDHFSLNSLVCTTLPNSNIS